MPSWGPPPPPGFGYGNVPPQQPYGEPPKSDRGKKSMGAEAASTAHSPRDARQRSARDSSMSPVALKPRSTLDRDRDESLFATMPPTPTGSWDRSYFQGYHDTPSSRTSLPLPPGTPTVSGSFGALRSHSPTPNQTDLFNMPLQSPSSRGFLPSSYLSSPSTMIPLGFSPSPVSRLSDTHFPLPSLHGHEELPRWRGPAPQSSSNYPDSRDTSPNRPSGGGAVEGHHDDEPEPILPPRKARRR
jgi:hypothetical protein